MRITYANDELRLIAEDPTCVPSRWGRDLVRAYRKKIGILSAATDERDLYAMRSLHLERLSGDRSGTSSIRLNDQFRMILTFHTEEDGRVVVVLDVVDYH